jgi:hypothetical protein
LPLVPHGSDCSLQGSDIFIHVAVCLHRLKKTLATVSSLL